VINFAVARLVSRITAAPPEPIQQFVDDLRVPNCARQAPVR
jgi:cation/acetate symporter